MLLDSMVNVCIQTRVRGLLMRWAFSRVEAADFSSMQVLSKILKCLSSCLTDLEGGIWVAGGGRRTSGGGIIEVGLT